MKDKKILSWALYDWANSAFATTIMAGFFPVFLKAYWGKDVDPIITTAKLGTTLSFTSFLMAVLSPFMGALSDLRGHKKLYLVLFMLLGVFGCLALGQLGVGEWGWALIIYGIAYIGFNQSCVFYDSLLPSVARGTKMDYASSLGYSLGYLGGGVLFLVNVLWYLHPETFGFADGVSAVKASFISVGVWWLLFSIPLLMNVPEIKMAATKESVFTHAIQSLKLMKKTIKDLRNDKNILLFMMAFWLYIDGVYTVMTMAVDYGMGIGLESKHLISALLITQFVGFPFALIFGHVTKRFGCRKPILLCLGIYTITIFLAIYMSQSWHFYALACVLGMVMGGVQSLSRSMFGNMVPAEKSGEYFAFMNLVGKFASIFGPLLVGGTVFLTGNQRAGMLGLLVLFIGGGALLLQVKEPRFED
jgi:UMF1 family MFS transporter